MELLLPAGSMESARAAILSGADAVYLGAPEFNARAGAKNFTPEELSDTIAFAHLRGAKVYITTNDGSMGMKGFVTDAMKELDGYTYFYTCGPEPMLKGVYDTSVTEGQLSFEARMGCGFGACMGCTCETKYGHKRICKEGPVLLKEEVIW